MISESELTQQYYVESAATSNEMQPNVSTNNESLTGEKEEVTDALLVARAARPCMQMSGRGSAVTSSADDRASEPATPTHVVYF